VTPEALREDAGRFDGRCLVKIVDPQKRVKRKSPGPARARRIMLRVTDDLDNREDRLPDSRVTDREIAALDRRPPR
jgi:hypothetical protein